MATLHDKAVGSILSFTFSPFESTAERTPWLENPFIDYYISVFRIKKGEHAICFATPNPTVTKKWDTDDTNENCKADHEEWTNSQLGIMLHPGPLIPNVRTAFSHFACILHAVYSEYATSPLEERSIVIASNEGGPVREVALMI